MFLSSLLIESLVNLDIHNEVFDFQVNMRKTSIKAMNINRNGQIKIQLD